MEEKETYIINSEGEREIFSFEKIYQSAKKAGASDKLALEIASQIRKEIFSGMSTFELSDRVFELLLQKNPSSAIKFNLKRALEKLGPSGFPFEKFVGKIFEFEGFKVKLNQIVPGSCLNYEIDFIAQKEKIILIGECKYHHVPGARVDLQVALANYARFVDIEKGKFLNSNFTYESILVTNTKFTEKAISYSKCVGVKLLGWKYPEGKGLEFLIEKNQLYPITILPAVTQKIANFLIEKGIVLVRDIFSKNFETLKFSQKEKIKREGRILLKIG